MMSLSRTRCVVTTLLRTTTTCHQGIIQSRNLAIMPTVKKASDTSAMEFAAPSHVSLSTQVAEMAQNISDFYSNTDSSIQIPEQLKLQLKDEIDKKTRVMIEDSDDPLDNPLHVEVPEQVKIRENPLFGVYKDSRGPN